MRVLYLAHRIRDPRGIYYVTQHIRQAEAIAVELWSMGAAVICPGKNTFLFDGALPDETWLAGDLEIIDRCDAVVLAPSWRFSEGAKAEREFALRKGLPVFEWPTDTDAIKDFTHGKPTSSGEVVKAIVDRAGPPI